MRRRGAIAAAATLLAAGILTLPGEGAGGGIPVVPETARAADCVPVQHSKSVVKRKKVRRRGKIVKVKRKRVVSWTTCEPRPAAPACDESASNLGVIARDLTGFTFTLSRPCVSAGVVSVQLNNQGDDAHALALRPAGSGAAVYRLPGPHPSELEPGTQVSGDLQLSAGDWYLWCDLPLHEEQGMNVTLAVR